ncbi:MAG: ABC transporter permease subunit [Saprospiraceae bacterium]|nr:ABC transporter permease subunit [Saprospiraceae bacterium]
MLRYVLKRILIFIPTLVIISLVSFGLSKLAPGDPIDRNDDSRLDIRDRELVYHETAHFWGLDKPAFYFSFSSQAYPDTLYKIVLKERRKTLQNLVAQYGNWSEIENYYHHIQSLELFLFSLSNTNQFKELSIVRSNVREFYLQYQDHRIHSIFKKLEHQVAQDSLLASVSEGQFTQLENAYMNIKENATPNKLLIPDIKWYGFDNQYHHWFSNFLTGNFGRSYHDSRPVANKLKDAIFWTLIMNSTAILIAYLLSIPLGVFSAVSKDTIRDRIITITLFILYSLPTFWIATMLMIFLTLPQYGIELFPTMGLGNVAKDASFWEKFTTRAEHLVLPIFCLTYTSLAFISRQMRGSMLDVLQQDFVRTARAKGLPENKVIWKHAFRNSLFPIITIFAAVFPAAIAGSVVIEVIFNIPGMGKLTIDAISTRDYPVVYTVLMLSAVLTMIGILVADIMYAILDPRVSYSNKK